MEVYIEIEEGKTVTISSLYGNLTIKTKRSATVKFDNTTIYTIYYTEDEQFIASVPPTVIKIEDPINFAKIFETKAFTGISKEIKKTILPAMAIAAGYEDVIQFVKDKIIKTKIIDYTDKDAEEIYSDSIVVITKIGERSITSSWKKIETPYAPTISRFLITNNLKEIDEKQFIAKTLDELKKLPTSPKEDIIKYAVKYNEYLVLKNLEHEGLIQLAL